MSRRAFCVVKFLKESSLSIKEISFLLGYQSSASFIKNFKALKKITPQIFRKRK